MIQLKVMKPLNYWIRFEPDLKKFIFQGTEIITFEIDKETNKFVLDATDLRIQKVILESDKLNTASFEIDKNKQQLTIKFLRPLTKGIYKLYLQFTGEHNDKLVGWYRSRYTVLGKEKYLVTSHFEPADARRAFPCIGHPAYTATFDIEMVVDKNVTAISNTLPVKKSILGKKKSITFAMTPKMSTYLLYLGVGEFEIIETKYKNILLRGIATEGNAQFTKFGLDVAKKSLAYYEKYFDFVYPLNKLDLIGVPDFSAGAMENWGAVTFRENALLYYPNKSSQSTKVRIAEVVAHELAHQWFGNLVTMKWWGDLWLNESFATYMAYKTMDQYWPEWKTWPNYIMDNVFGGMHLDSLQSSHPIKADVKDVGQIHELFDEIAYDKGGSVLRMLDIYLGEVKFRDGLRSYIKKYQYNNAVAQDLWSELENISKKEVKKLMQSFIEQTGFPVVTVQKENESLVVTQERFTFLTDKNTKEQWTIPLVIQETEKIRRYLLKKKTEHLETSTTSNFLFINKNIAGFFLTHYKGDIFDKLLKHVTDLTDEDMLGLIHDEFALVMADKNSYEGLQKFINASKKNLSIVTSYYFIAKLIGFYHLIHDTQMLDQAKVIAQNLLLKIGYQPRKDEDLYTALVRSQSISTLVLGNDKKTNEFVQSEFTKFIGDPSLVHPDLHAVIFSSAVFVDSMNYEKVLGLYRKSITQEEQSKLLMALGNSQDSKQIKKTLTLALSDEVRFIQIAYLIAGLMRNTLAHKEVYIWFMENWMTLVKRSSGLAIMILRHLLQSIVPVAGISNEKEIIKFLGTHTPEGLEKTVDQVLVELEINSRFVKKYKK